MDDPRLTPARGDIAAKYLEGKVKAGRFVAGETFEVIEALAPLRQAPAFDAELMTQVLASRARRRPTGSSRSAPSPSPDHRSSCRRWRRW